MAPFRVAVLECDTPVPKVEKQRGSYGSIFQTLLSKGTEASFCIIKYHVVDNPKFPDLSDVDGILITGSKHTAVADVPWISALADYIRMVLTTSNTPVVGICFGHQIIGRALGAKGGVAPGGWEISVNKIDLNDDGQKIFGVPSLNLHQMHRDEVASVPEGLVCIGSSPRCPVQGLYKPKSVLSLQAHPEFDEFIMKEIIKVRHEFNVFDDDMANDGTTRAANSQDGALVATKIWEFFLDTVA